MPEHGIYGQFCPISMASEVLCTRWTMLILREFLCGSTRFNDLRRGVPRMSPTLLSKRLRDLEEAGIIQSVPGPHRGTEYNLTAAGEDLRPLVMAVGTWGHKWIESRLSLKNLDPSLLMWDMRRNLDPRPLPRHRCTIQFQYPELAAANQNWWLVIDKGAVDLCRIDPGFEVDLLVRGPLRNMTAVWMGLSDIRTELAAGHLEVDGDPAIARAMQTWLGLSPFAREERRVA
ncbi:MAG: transcriptional regulator [Tabrizicola sp.]|nr:transcriptional regulator [Tabrizicola sp.]